MTKQESTPLEYMHPYKKGWFGKLLSNAFVGLVAEYTSDLGTNDNPLAKVAEIATVGAIMTEQAGVRNYTKSTSRVQWALDSTPMFTARTIATVYAFEMLASHAESLSGGEYALLGIVALSIAKSVHGIRTHHRQAQLADQLNNPPKPKKEKLPKKSKIKGVSKSETTLPPNNDDGYILYTNNPARHTPEAVVQLTDEERIEIAIAEMKAQSPGAKFEEELEGARQLTRRAIQTHGYQRVARYLLVELQINIDHLKARDLLAFAKYVKQGTGQISDMNNEIEKYR